MLFYWGLALFCKGEEKKFKSFLYSAKASFMFLRYCILEIIVICILISPSWSGPFEPAVGHPDSTAIHMDDPNFLSWSNGWENYIVGSNCLLEWQTPEKGLGKAQGTSYEIVSLGRGGQITMTFGSGIGDREGYDFAVFENGIDNTFLELAYVEVSSDGDNFFRFDCNSLTENPVGGFGAVDPTDIDGFAGKYKQGYGTGFDLAEFKGVSQLLDTNNVGWVRIIDIVGDGSFFDTWGKVVYDPYPTVGSAGFDLDAIGVINMRTADFNNSRSVDMFDLLIMFEAWLSSDGDENWDDRCDISDEKDGMINLLDFTVFARQCGQGE